MDLVEIVVVVEVDGIEVRTKYVEDIEEHMG